MAKYGLQPNGTVILDNGRVWNPNDDLPADSVSAFNSTPMGSPLNGLGTMAPTAVAPQPQPQQVSQQPPSPVAPKGMMFQGLNPGGNFSGIASNPDGSLTQPQMDLSTSHVPKPSFFGQGGTGRSIAGILGDAMLGFAGQPGVYGPAMEKRRQEQFELDKLSAQQQAEFQRQWALEAYKRGHPAPGSIETNYNFLASKDQRYGDSYLRAESNPMTLMTDPTSGAVGFYPKGGYAPTSLPAASAAPVRVTSKAQVDALPPGTQFIAPDGSMKVKS